MIVRSRFCCVTCGRRTGRSRPAGGLARRGGGPLLDGKPRSGRRRGCAAAAARHRGSDQAGQTTCFASVVHGEHLGQRTRWVSSWTRWAGSVPERMEPSGCDRSSLGQAREHERRYPARSSVLASARKSWLKRRYVAASHGRHARYVLRGQLRISASRRREHVVLAVCGSARRRGAPIAGHQRSLLG